MKVNILGTEYEVKLDVSGNDDRYLKELAGYTDETSKVIAVSDCKKTNFDKPQIYKDKTLLHEIIHSFLHESGLPKETCEWHCEEMVEWCATMAPKIMKAYESIVKPKRTVDVNYIDCEDMITIELDGHEIAKAIKDKMDKVFEF